VTIRFYVKDTERQTGTIPRFTMPPSGRRRALRIQTCDAGQRIHRREFGEDCFVHRLFHLSLECRTVICVSISPSPYSSDSPPAGGFGEARLPLEKIRALGHPEPRMKSSGSAKSFPNVRPTVWMIDRQVTQGLLVGLLLIRTSLPISGSPGRT